MINRGACLPGEAIPQGYSVSAIVRALSPDQNRSQVPDAGVGSAERRGQANYVPNGRIFSGAAYAIR